MRLRFIILFFTLALVGSISGCAGYAEHVHGMRQSLLSGNKAAALKEADKALDVEDPDDYPIKLEGEVPLLILERGMIKHGLAQYESSAQDFKVADRTLEMLDFKNDTIGNIGKFLFSDDSTIYKAPPYEKLLLNTYGMLNYLALGEVEKARVEARRFRIMQTYLSDEKSGKPTVGGLGSYLAGLTFEISGRYEDALRFYEDALSTSDTPLIRSDAKRLLPCTGYRSDQLKALLEPSETQQAPTVAASDGSPKESPAPTGCEIGRPGKGTIIVVSGAGLAPHKEPKRIPIGAAIVIAGALLGAATTSQANELAAKGLVTWVNFPVLRSTKSRFSGAQVHIDGQAIPTHKGANIEEQVIASWDQIKGTFMVAAITRTITRALAGEATEAIAESSGSASGLATLLGVAVTGAMAAADTPDTRSWVTLPAAVWLTRADVPPGTHKIQVIFAGKGGRSIVEREIKVSDGGYTIVSVASMQ